MSFILTEEQEELLALVRKFSEKEILPYAHQMDVEAHFVPGLIQKIADLGFMVLMYLKNTVVSAQMK